MNGRFQRAPRPPEYRTRVWIFQANPTRYRIFDSLRAEREELWNLNQHIHSIAVGDRVLIWISGDKAGIYAVGTVVEAPVLRADSPRGQAYWNEKATGKQLKLRVRVRYDRVMLDHPLLKEFLQCDSELGNLAIIRQPRGTNFPVTQEEWRAIQGWLSETESAEGA